MNFAASTVQLSLNGDVAEAEWRQDCGAGDVITATLSYTVGIISYRWRLIGRPEGSEAGGVGPEPLYLGSSASAAFTVDIKGTYIVECLVNGGSPDATIIVGGVAYLEEFLSPDGLALRLLGPGETDQDDADPQVAQGWIKMLNRWLKTLRGFIDSGAVSDHKVSVDSGDVADFLFAKLSAGPNITLTKAGSEPHETVQVAATGDTYGGKLWTGLVPDLLAHPPCDAVFHEQGGCDPSVFGTMWSEIATGVWRRNVVGHILGAKTDDVGAFVGMRLFAWSAGVELAHTGPYVLDDIGMDPVTHADTYPQMHRADDFASTAQVLHGAWFNITGGTAWGGHAFRLTNADPVGEIDVAALVWEIVDPLTAAPTDELLTAAQLSLASPTTTIASQNVSSGSGEVELVVCTEHDAALAGTTLPGDKPWRFHLFCCLIGSDDPAATTVINCYLRGSLDAAWHLVATTQSLHNTVYGMMVEAGTLGADYAMGAGEKLQAHFTAASTSTIGQTVGLVFNDAAHSTFIDVPVTIGNAGTDDHSQLIKRNVLNADGTGQHQRRFVDDVALPPISLDGSGNLIPDPSSNIVLFDSEVTVNRIDKSQWPTGVGRLTLLFPQKGHVGNSAGPSGSFAEVQMGNFGGLSGAQGEQADFGYDGLINLLLIAGAWNLDGAPNMGRSML